MGARLCSSAQRGVLLALLISTLAPVTPWAQDDAVSLDPAAPAQAQDNSGCVPSPHAPDDPCYQNAISTDSWCCDVEWDTQCQQIYESCVTTFCAASPHALNDPCYQQVINADPWCCDVEWNAECEAMHAACTVADCVESPHDAQDPCYQEVVAEDPWCCNETWDQQCEDDYSICQAGGCVPSPYGFEDPCYQHVIAEDPWCCNNEWDHLCEQRYALCSGPEPSDEVWVDFSYTGTEKGTQAQPFQTLAGALQYVNPAGTIHILAGATPEAPLIAIPVTLLAHNGTATIGSGSVGDLLGDSSRAKAENLAPRTSQLSRAALVALILEHYDSLTGRDGRLDPDKLRRFLRDRGILIPDALLDRIAGATREALARWARDLGSVAGHTDRTIMGVPGLDAPEEESKAAPPACGACPGGRGKGWNLLDLLQHVWPFLIVLAGLAVWRRFVKP